MSNFDVKDAVREKYSQGGLTRARGGKLLLRASGKLSCGSTSARDPSNPITSNLYDASQAGAVPEEAMLASLGCGNPTAFAQLKPGETVLDLGSGGGR